MIKHIPQGNDKTSVIKREILCLCIRNSSISISEVSKETGLSIPTATKIISELISDGLLCEDGKAGTGGGRRPSTFCLNAGAGFFVGVDIARHHFHIAISDFKGEVIKFVQDIEFVLSGNDESFSKMCEIIRGEVAAAGVEWGSVIGVGISLSCRVNPETGYSLTYFNNLPIKDIFEEKLNVDVTIDNDSRAMAYGEYINLGQESDKDMIFVNISWGLGMGMILDGKLYYGKSGFSGEIGHVPMLKNEIMCRCGKMGCLETGASGCALHRIILEKLSDGRPSSLAKIYAEKGDVELIDILDAVKAGDVLAIDCMGKIGEKLGLGIASIINIFNPGLVVIGGRLSVGRDYLMLPVKTAINRLSLSKVSSDTRLKFSTLGRSAAATGDCLLSRAKLLGII